MERYWGDHFPGETGRDADQIRLLRPELRKYLQRFDACFKRSDTRGHLSVYTAQHRHDGRNGLSEEREKTPGVQWCGATGKQDNCVVTVHLGYAVADFHCLVDSELFLPESWSRDRPRCRAADIPDDLVHRPQTDIAWELYARARSHGIVFPWLTFDEGSGKSGAWMSCRRKAPL